MREIFAKRLKALRNAKGISQAKLADDIGVDDAFIGQLELEKSFVSVDTLVILAKYFNVSTDYLLGLVDD